MTKLPFKLPRKSWWAIESLEMRRTSEGRHTSDFRTRLMCVCVRESELAQGVLVGWIEKN